ncbi:hypothetical protein M9Y10_024986 [Tritrichomonas musculus]|uniref:Uncharacterized protein n=1 Tax=Tritrichomonas musculus TaxID=1915356 RepID=A0ABR2HCL2_9EUKA
MIFTILAPLIPLLPDGQHYPDGFSLPKRMRNMDALDIPRLTKKFRESLVYEEINPISIETKNDYDQNKNNNQLNSKSYKTIQSDIAVLGVLSPYSLLQHVMIMEMSDNRYLPGPESFSEEEWLKLSEIARRVVISMKSQEKIQSNGKLQYGAQCCGFNWSPFAWGQAEEKMSCQSITTKFHLMIWQWSQSDLKESLTQKVEIPKNKEEFFFKNGYNELFAKLILNELKIDADENGEIICGPRGLFLPFDLLEKSDKNGLEDNIKKMREIAIIVERIIGHLNSCLMRESTEKMFNILNKTAERNLTDDELKELRKNPEIRTLDEALNCCHNELEKKIIELIYPAVQNRSNFSESNFSVIPEEIWMKGFGFSMVMCESNVHEVLKSGLYVCLKVKCGSGGVAETLGCYLKRPEDSLANDETMIMHNHAIWKIKEDLEERFM